MLGKIGKLMRSPGFYARRIGALCLRQASVILGDRSFFLEGQMDINPKSLWHEPRFVARFGGFGIPGETVRRPIENLEPWDVVRRDMLILLLRSVIVRGIPGAMAELGVFQGATARLIHHYEPDRMLYLLDTFSGFGERSVREEKMHTGHPVQAQEFADTSLEKVQKTVAAVNGNVTYVPGFFPDSVSATLAAVSFSFVHVDADLYAPIRSGLEFFYPRLSPGGILVVHDYNAWVGARTAVDAFMAEKREIPIPMPDKNGSVVIVKQ
ncbi:MAG: TylF/MycF/NovP-related O-methyltransferase [Gammaproteobacteria bacterium]